MKNLALLTFIFYITGADAFAARCIAHRGYFADVSENSVGSIQAALALGADGAEFDVRHTSDGIPILLHDETFDRVVSDDSSLCRRGVPVSEMSWDEISENCRLKDGQQFSRFDEALQVFRGTDQLAFVEVKDQPSELFLEYIKTSELDFEQIRFISFKTKYLRKLRRKLKKIKSLRLSRFVPFFQFRRGMNVDEPLRRYTFFSRIFGQESGVWTINDLQALQENHQKNIDFITTDEIKICLSAKTHI